MNCLIIVFRRRYQLEVENRRQNQEVDDNEENDDAIDLSGVETFGLPENVQVRQADTSRIKQIFSSRMLDLCASSLMNKKLRPLSAEITERNAFITSQCEWLICYYNQPVNVPQRLPLNWVDDVTQTSSIEFSERTSLFKYHEDRYYTSPQNFIFEWKPVRGRNLLLKQCKSQISLLQIIPFFNNFLYKYSLNSNSINVQDIDGQLENPSGTLKFHEEILTPLLLQKAVETISHNYFCHKCCVGFETEEKILPHVIKFHPDFINNETIESVKSARETRRTAELEEAYKCRHQIKHPECLSCFRD